MTRTKRDPESRQEMCDRLVWLMETVLRMRPSELARKLGYANPATIMKVKQKKTFPDTDRLQKLAEIETEDGAKPNLHWLITGKGVPLLGGKGKEVHRTRAMAEKILRDLGPEKVEALGCLLGGPKIE